MKRLRQYLSSLKQRASDAVARAGTAVGARLGSRTSLFWLALLSLAVILQVVFNFPAALAPELALVPHGTLCALTFVGWLCAVLGTRRGLISGGIALSLVAPLLQPLLAIPATLLFAGAVSYVVSRRQLKRPRLTFALTLILACSLYFCLAVFVLPLMHAVTVEGWSWFTTVVALVVAVAATFAIGMRNRWRKEPKPTPRWRMAAYGVTLLLLYAFIPLTAVCNRWTDLAELQLRHSMQPEHSDTLVETVQDRLLPRATAETYMQNLNDDYMTDVEPPHLQARLGGGPLRWQAAVHNQNRWGRIFGSATRVVAVDAGRADSHADATPNSAFVFSDKSWVTKAVFAARHPFSQVAQTCYYQNADGSWSMLMSYTSKKVSGRLPAPMVMVPHFAGVMEMSQNGIARDYTVEQAAKRFPGAVLYPTELYRQQAEAYGKWHDGWTGSKILQQNVWEISEDDAADGAINRQPYVQHFKGLGLQLMVSLEPKGDKQWALTEVLLCDAATGKLRAMKPPAGLIGPRQARLNVRSSDTRIDWSRIRKDEPRLVVSPRGIFWLVAIVSHWENEPDRHPYVTSVLVDALRSSDCYTFQHRKEMDEFLAQPRPTD